MAFGFYLSDIPLMHSQNCATCPLLTQNIDLEIDPVHYPLGNNPFQSNYSFQLSLVPGWLASHGSPHHIQYNPGIRCRTEWTMPNNTETSCLAASSTEHSEGIFQNLMLLSDDPFVRYCLSYKIDALHCPVPDIGQVYIRSAITKNLVNNTSLNGNTQPPNISNQQILETLVGQNYSNTVNTEFQVNSGADYNQLWLYAQGYQNSGWTFVRLSDIKLTCRTTALTGITFEQNSGLEFQFTATNASEQSTFVSYHWDFGDGNTSQTESPVHTYGTGGTYEVCLDIIDNNGCCARRCETINLCTLDCNNLCDAIEISNPAGSSVKISDLFNNNTIPHTLNGVTYTIQDLQFYLNTRLIMDVNVNMESTVWVCDRNTQIDIDKRVMINKSKFKGCDYLWNGIRINRNLSTITDSKIEDAKTAVEINKGVFNAIGINAVRDTFENNIVGINFSTSSTPQKFIFNIISRCIFITTASLKPIYNSPVPYQESVRFGILSGSGTEGVDVQYSIFDNIRTGIDLQKSNLLSRSNIFIGRETNISFVKQGINVAATGPRTRIINQNKFIDLHQGINARDSDLSDFFIQDHNVFNNEFTPPLSSVTSPFHIRLERLTSSNVLVGGDNYFSNRYGTSIVVSGSIGQAEISNNIFNMSGNGNFSVMSLGITNSPLGHKFISGNTFNQNIEQVGIQSFRNINLLNSNFIDFGDNILNHTGLSLSDQGGVLGLSNVQDSRISYNDFNDSNNSIFVIKSPGNIYCCNYSTTPGRSFSFNDESMSDLYGNNMHTLYLNSTGFIGRQISMGNLWEGSTSSAVMENGNAAKAFANLFTYSPTQQFSKPAIILPQSIEFDWFRPTGSFRTCFTENSYCDVIVPSEGPEDGVNASDTLNMLRCEKSCEMIDAVLEMKSDSTLYFPDQTLWSVLEYWAKACGNIPLAAGILCDPDSTIHIVNDVVNWVNAEGVKDELYSTDEDIIDEVMIIRQEIDSLYILREPVYTEDDFINENPVLFLYSNMIDSLHGRFFALADSVRIRRKNEAIDLIPFIESLPTPYSFLALRKQVWVLELRMLAYGDSTISSNEIAFLHDVAQMCSSEMGAVVFEAMGLLEILGENYWQYDPLAACVYDLTTPRSVSENLSKEIRIYPNPTVGLLNITLDQPYDDVELYLFNDVGSKVWQEKLPGNRMEYEKDISVLSGGIYYYQLQSNNSDSDSRRIIATGKIVLIK